MNEIILKKGREKPARQFHPWLFSGAIDKISGSPEPGEIVRVIGCDEDFVALGYYNPFSQIQIRLLEWNDNISIDKAWWEHRLATAIESRSRFKNDEDTNAYRLVFGEADFLPGLIVDKYADFIVMQSLTRGIEAVKDIIAGSLNRLLKPTGIYERSDASIRSMERLKAAKGRLVGEEPPDLLDINENGLKFRIDIKNGQKTGFYLDQRDNRMIASRYVLGGRMLDCFSYCGGFAVYALRGGADSVMLVDSSQESLALAKTNLILNGLDTEQVEYRIGDAFRTLRDLREAGSQFDLVVLDPPKFASSKSHLQKALAGYKDINLTAMQILRPGGILVTFSCSGAVTLDSLKMAVFWASVDAHRQVQILQTMHHAEDHPRLLSFPEGEYLKGMICRVE